MEKDYGIIYKATNTVTGKIYIGQTWGLLSKRIWRHIHSDGCCYFHNTLLKYGPDKFVWEILQKEDTQEKLDEGENRLIKLCRSNEKKYGYNLREGGSCGKFTARSKEKMRISALRYFKSEEARKKQSAVQKKRYSKFEERVKHSRAHGGRPFYARKEDEQKLFQTQVEAAKFIGSNQGSIKSALQGKTKEIKGWILSYNKIEQYICPIFVKKQILLQHRLQILKTINLKNKKWLKELSHTWKICEYHTWTYLKLNFPDYFNSAVKQPRPQKRNIVK
jgi:group I intron endonuclease